MITLHLSEGERFGLFDSDSNQFCIFRVQVAEGGELCLHVELGNDQAIFREEQLKATEAPK